jgi:hypothetical protein
VSTVRDLLARATSRTEVRPGDARTGSTFERVVADGQRYFVKRLSPAGDWVMRITGDTVHRPYLVWQHGIMAAAPACIDPTVVAMEIEGTGRDAVATSPSSSCPRATRRCGPSSTPGSSSTSPPSPPRSGAGAIRSG